MRKIFISLFGILIINIANAQWIQKSINEKINLKSVHFTDANTGYAVGDSCYAVVNNVYCCGIILKTTDGGTNWTTQNYYLNPLHSVFFLNQDTGFAVGNKGLFVKTTNGGTNWEFQTIDSNYYFTNVCFTAYNTGYAVGGINVDSTYLKTLILKTTDGGTNWSQLSTGLTNNCVLNICFPNPDTGFATAYNGKILKTTDAGSTWTLYSVDCEYGNKCFFVNDTLGYFTGSKFEPSVQEYHHKIFKTINGGAEWTLVKSISGSSEIGSLNSIFFINVDTGYIVGNGLSIIKTENGGTVWTYQPLAGYLVYLNDVFFTGDNTGYAVGDHGAVFKSTEGGFCEVNTDNGLFRIYPNPVADQMTIETGQVKNKSTLTVSKINGQEIIRVLFENNKLQIDMTGLTSGIYLVKLITNEKVTVRKIVKE